MVVQDKLYTVEDLWEISHQDTDSRYELDEGTLIEMAPVGDTHGFMALWLGSRILAYVTEHKLGRPTTETGYILWRDPKSGRGTVRSPDVGFVVQSRVQPFTGRFIPVAPDLAVEIVSPGDSARQIRRKVEQYHHAGTRLVWIIYPDDRLIDVHEAGQKPDTKRMGDALDGGDIIPGFLLSVRELFEQIEG